MCSVLPKTCNLFICYFAGNGKEMYLNVKARAVALFALIKPIACAVFAAVTVVAD